MITNEEKLKIEVLRQRELKRLNKQRNFRKYEPERFDVFEFGKSIGYIKAIEHITQILGYNIKDIESIDNKE